MLRLALVGLLLVACGDDSSASDAGTDTGGSDTGVDTGVDTDAGDDAGDDDAGGDDAGGDDGGDDAGEADAGEDAGMRMLEDGRCRVEGDCTGLAESCLPPGAFAGCGICMVPLVTCDNDDDCTTSGHICDNRPEDCHCGAETTCRAGCTAGSCDPGLECGDTGRCEPAACEDADDCPSQFDCAGTACGRRTCDSDADCNDDGWCVGGDCYDMPGSCTPPVA